MDIALLAVYLGWVAFVVGYAVVALRTGRTPRTCTPPGVEHLDLHQAAFLTGGPSRVADVALLALRATGAVHIGRDGTVTATGRGPADPVAAGVLRTVEQAGGNTSLADARHLGARAPEVQAIGDQLLGFGLMRRPGTGGRRRAARLLLLATSTISFIGMILVGPFRITAGLAAFAGAVLCMVMAGRGSLSGRTGHTQRGMAYVVRLRREAALQTGLDQTVAGGAGLGVIAVHGLRRLTDYELLDVFRQARVPALAAGAASAAVAGDAFGIGAGDSGGTGGDSGGGASWCGSVSCADSGFKGSSCAGPSGPGCSSPSSWSCSSSSGSSCGSSSSGGSSCGGGGGGGSF